MMGIGGRDDDARLLIARFLIGGALALVPASSFARESGPVSPTTCTASQAAPCDDKELSRLEAGIAVAYQKAAERVQADPSLSAELAREHAMFLQSREYAAASTGASLVRFLKTRQRWLDAISPARQGWEGTWISGSGRLQLKPRAEGTYEIIAQADDPIRGSYTCAFRGVGRQEGNMLAVSWDVSDDEEDGADGWTLHLRRDGGLLRLTQHRNMSEARTAPFCGVHGSLEGAYLPASVLPEPVTASRAATEAQLEGEKSAQ